MEIGPGERPLRVTVGIVKMLNPPGKTSYAPPPSVASQAPQQAFASSRTLKM